MMLHDEEKTLWSGEQWARAICDGVESNGCRPSEMGWRGKLSLLPQTVEHVQRPPKARVNICSGNQKEVSVAETK